MNREFPVVTKGLRHCERINFLGDSLVGNVKAMSMAVVLWGQEIRRDKTRYTGHGDGGDQESATGEVTLAQAMLST